MAGNDESIMDSCCITWYDDTFALDEVMKWRWKEEMERNCKTPVFETMLNAFVLHFSAPVSRTNFQTIWPVFAIQTFTHPEGLVLYFLHAKIKRGILRLCMHKSQEERIPKKFSIIYPLWIRKATIAKPLVLLTSPIETTTFLRMKIGRKKEGEEKKKRMHFHVMWVYSTWRGETGEGVNEGSSLTHAKPPPGSSPNPPTWLTTISWSSHTWFYRGVS